MPKLKTHKGTAKRIRLTPNGKVIRGRAGGNHLLQKKSAARKRNINKPARVSGANANNLKRALGAKK